ncbi:MAG: NAD(P)H-hydrate dehydratase [Rhodospirillales bacterium]
MIRHLPDTPPEVLSVEEMYRADALTIDRGTPGEVLMENAGRALAEAVLSRFADRPVHVLCGPGNNGGDGFVAARHLRATGFPVRLYLLGGIDDLRGDAATHANRWQSDTAGGAEPLTAYAPAPGDVTVDCLFGAGLTRAIDGEVKSALEKAEAGPVVACDLPSGVNGDTGDVLGFAPTAAVTVTFARLKPGHLLLPGRSHCGEIVVADIGIPDTVIAEIASQTFVNGPTLWGRAYPVPASDANKFSRGHLQIVGGARMTGAARLAARAARRAGAGLATILSPAPSADVYRAGDPGTLVDVVDDRLAFESLLADERRNAVVVGPGNGVDARTRDLAGAALASERPTVLDADAISVFGDDPAALFAMIGGPCVLTPHEGEFARLFDASGDKLARTRRAAVASGAVVLLKGADTVIAAPDGGGTCRAAINATGAADLATAGSGDVLAGLIGALMAQGMGPFEAACAGAWLHGKAGEAAPAGLIAEDLPERLPAAISGLRERLLSGLQRN